MSGLLGRSDRAPGEARPSLLPPAAPDWGDWGGFFGIRKSPILLVELFPLTFFDFFDVPADDDEDEGDLVADFDLALPLAPLPLRWLGGDIVEVVGFIFRQENNANKYLLLFPGQRLRDNCDHAVMLSKISE